MLTVAAETRLLDFTLCDSQGSVICIMHGLELRKVSSGHTSAVEARYDLIYQPISVNISPSKLQITARAHEVNDLHYLLNVLDTLSLDYLSTLVQEELPNTDKVTNFTPSSAMPLTMLCRTASPEALPRVCTPRC